MPVRRTLIAVLTALCAFIRIAPAVAQTADRPNNPVGVHLMIHDVRTDENIDKHTAWARRVCGPWGYVKIFEHSITTATPGASDSLIKLVETLYERELIPVLRLGGEMTDGIWQRPPDTPDGTFGDIAEAFKRIVRDLPLSDECPLYIEVWNEPNLGLEWSGTPRPADFARMYIRCAKAIRSIGDPRIKVAPGAMSPGGQYDSLDFIDAMCKAEPEFIHSFDYWATHPYPGGTPPQHNIHDMTTTMKYTCIDLWVYELDRLAANGCDISRLKVIGTETGYRLGHGGGDIPIVDSTRRADYHLRTFRDYWMQWPEVLGMCIWDFSNPFDKMNLSTWVHADDIADADGWPKNPTLDFSYVAALAKPTSDHASVSGRLVDARTGGGVPGVDIHLEDSDLRCTTDRLGGFILSPLEPTAEGETHTLQMSSPSHAPLTSQFAARPGRNVILESKLPAMAFATLRGRVTNTATSAPLFDALVRVEPGHFGTRTDRQGRFAFPEILPHGYYDVTISAEGFYPHRQKGVLLEANKTLEHAYRLGPGTPVDDNMLTNTGFESADGERPLALNWDAVGPADAIALVQKTAYAGDRAQRFDARAGKTVGVIQWTNYSSVKPGRRYRLQAWMRTESVKAGEGQGARLTATVVNNPHKTLDELTSKSVLTGDAPWTLITLDFTAPPDAGRVSLQPELTADHGRAWVDEVAVIELPRY